MEWIGALISIIGVVGSIVKSIYNRGTSDKSVELAESNLQLNKETAEKNFDLSKEQFEYQKELNDLVMQREDTAYQRQVDDLQKAGLSPLNIAGGSPATALTSANAPQFDISGINQAIGNALGAYNDVFNRRLNRQQFALQSAVQTSQAYTQIMESRLNRKYLGLQMDYLDEKLKWEKAHGFRDLDWKSELINFVENLGKHFNASSVIPSIGDLVSAGFPGTLQFLSSDSNKPGFKLPSSNDVKDYLTSIIKPENEVTQKDIDSDLSEIEKNTKQHVDNALQFLNKDIDKDLKTIWEYTQAKDYYDDYETFRSIFYSKGGKPAMRKYASLLNLSYQPRKRLKLGQ